MTTGQGPLEPRSGSSNVQHLSPDSDSTASDRIERAETLFLEALARVDGDVLDAEIVDALIVAHPELRDELRDQHANWNWLGQVAPSESGDSDAPSLTDKLAVGAVLQLAGTRDEGDRYTLLDEVARGGMGTIFKVWDAHLKRTLAMKVSFKRRRASGSSSRPSSSSSEFRFVEEASLMGRLDHPGVVPVHDIGVDAVGHMYFTMRLVKGHNLKTVFELVRSTSDGWSLARAVGVLVKVCETLGYAHSKGVIHRDVKPANVMVGRFGQAYVMDWGLARSAGREHGSTRTGPPGSRDVDSSPGAGLVTTDGQVLGTPAYMPPEQARGELGLIGSRSDIYAVGAMLYDLLSGHAPFSDGRMTAGRTVLQALREGPPTALDRAAPWAPGELVAIAEKAMARESADRYTDMQMLAADLRAYLEGRVVGAHRTGAVVEFRKWVQRNRLTAGAVGVTVLFLVLGTVAVAWVQMSKSRALGETNRQLEAQSLELFASNDRLNDQRARADLAAYSARIAAAQASLQSNRVDIASDHLEACPEELRGWEWHHLQSRLDVSVATLSDPAGNGARAWGVAFSPDGQRLVSGTFGGRLRTWALPIALEAPQSPDMVIEAHDRWIREVAIDGAGRWIATGSDDGTVRIWGLAGGDSIWSSEPTGVICDVSFDAEGERLVTASLDGTARIWRTATGVEEFVLRGHVGRVDSARFDASGERVITIGSDSMLRVWDAHSGSSLREAEVFDPLIETNRDKALGLSPDGRLVALGGPAGDLRVLDAVSLETVHFLYGHVGHVKSLAFSPDGSLLASASADQTLRIWDAETGAEVWIGRGHTSAVASVAWHPEGALLATSSDDGTVKLWDIGESADVDVFEMGRGMAVSVSIRPDGREIAIGRNTGPVLLNADTGEVRFGRAHRQLFESATAYDPTGTWLAASLGDDWTIGVWECAHPGDPAVLDGHADLVTDIEFSADARMLASSSLDGTVRVWRVADWSSEMTLGPHKSHVYCTTFRPGREVDQLVSGTRAGWLRVWDLDSGRVSHEWRGHGAPVRGVRFSPDGGLLATTSEDHTVKLWNTTDWTEVRTLRGHADGVHSPVFSPDGSRLATSSRDRSIRLWDVESGVSVATLLGHRGWVTALDFAPDGTWLVSGSNDKSVILWETTRSKRGARALREAMRRMVPRVEELYRQHGSAAATEDAIDRDATLSPGDARAARGLARMHAGG
ncbi:MAG: WD40 repeat protein [Chlamydiales bacterium]